jgi:hypothetical protein
MCEKAGGLSFLSVATVITLTYGKKEKLDRSSLDLLFGLAAATSFHNFLNIIDCLNRHC